MKMLKLSIILPLFLILVQPGLSQNNTSGQTDTNQIINRDIKIMEGVLDELFRLKPNTASGSSSVFVIANDRLVSSRSRGAWLPGYGIVFMVPDFPSTPFGTYNNRSFANTLNNTDDDNPVSVESVQTRMTEFLIQYAPAIRQLGENEYVTVIYGMDQANNFFETVRITGYAVAGSSSSSDNNDNRLPIISVSVLKSDIDALKRGDINESSFINRLQTSTIDRDESQDRLDLNLFARILETGIQNSDDDSFSINGRPAYFHLANFGAFYQFQLSMSPQMMYQNFNFIPFTKPNFTSVNIDSTLKYVTAQLQSSFNAEAFNEMTEEAQRDMMTAQREAMIEQERVQREILAQQREVLAEQEKARQEAIEQERQAREEIEQKRREAVENQLEALDDRLSLIKELMVDYGPTLSSLENNHSLLLSITISGRGSNEDLPERIDLRIAKSDLDELAQGDISREEALSRIIERRI